MTREKFYDSIAEDFDRMMNMYDTNRRIEVIFEDFLGNAPLQGKRLLDGGCGTGWFTRKAIQRGAQVVSLDIAKKLVEVTRQKNPGTTAVCGSILELPFEDGTFDYVISSDVIEHTPDPYKATKELIRVLKSEGKLCITVPNKSFWYFSVVLANALGIRKYKGFENWVPYYRYKRFLNANNLTIVDYKGIHLFPFVVKFLNGILYRLDKIFQRKLGFMMVNLAALAEKNEDQRYLD